MSPSSSEKRRLRVAKMIVRSVSNEVKNQHNKIQESVIQRIQQAVQNVMNGIWIGRGADEFVREMTQELLPEFGIFMTVVQNTNTHIDNAVEIMDTADQTALGKVNTLVDTFRAVY